MAGVGQQRQRVDAQAVDDLGDDEARVQHDAYREGGAEILGRVRVAVMAVSVIVAMVRVVVIMTGV